MFFEAISASLVVLIVNLINLFAVSVAIFEGIASLQTINFD